MGDRNLNRDAYAGTRAKVDAAGGDTSYAGREEIRKTGKLHPLVDPAGYGLIRKSWPRYVELPGGRFHNVVGIPMLLETLLDITGSMGENIKLAFMALPQMYALLTEGTHPVLGRYDPQIINASFGDVVDTFIHARSQAEMDEKIAEQLVLHVPEGGGGGNNGEDPEYGLFGAAFLTEAFITRYGLKSYHITVTDEPSHGHIDHANLVRVFGETVFEKTKENGYEFDPNDLPGTGEIVRELMKHSHAFMVCVGGHFAQYWSRSYGAERVVVIDSTRHLSYVQAVLIGLTEGVFDLQSVPDYLVGVGCSKPLARDIQRAVAGIPIGAQCALPNFDKIPGKGGMFANKRDLWPVADSAPVVEAAIEEKWL